MDINFQWIYDQLNHYYGSLNWWPAEDDYEMMVGAVLVQNTAWSNVDKALKNLGADLKPEKIAAMDQELLAQKIRSSGYFNQKAKKVKALTEWYSRYDFNIKRAKAFDGETVRKELLEVKGIGPETADCIMVYGLEKPFFVIDAYTRRLFERLGHDVPKNYDAFRLQFELVVEKNAAVYNQYHALIVEHCKQHCLKRNPKCSFCPLKDTCVYAAVTEQVPVDGVTPV